MKKIFLIITIVMAVSIVNGQKVVHFTYDASGNRISRVIDWNENSKGDTLVATASDTAGAKATRITEENRQEYMAKSGNKTIKIFPNPNDGYFTVEITGWNSDDEAQLLLSAVSGVAITEKKISSKTTKVAFRNHPDGTYLLTILLNGKRETWKILKR